MTTATPAPGTFTPIVEGTPPAPAPAPAPAAAPAAAPAPAPTPGPAKAEVPVEAEAGTKPGTFEYAPTQHAGLDAALAFVGKHGFGPEHPAIKAAVNGDFSLLKAQLAEKGAAGSDAYILLAENAHKEISSKEQARQTADKEALYATVGGEENWKVVSEWGKANADEAEQAALSSMLSRGGAEMKIAAGWLAGAYQRATGGVPEGEGSGPGVSEVRGQSEFKSDALSPLEYGRAVAKLRQTYKGRDFETDPAYLQLRDRRARFKG